LSPNWRGARRVLRRTPLSKSISQPVSRVLYGVLPEGRTRDGHSSGTPVTRRLQQPTRTADPDTDPGDRSPAPSLFGFAPGGVCRAASVAGNAVRSYRTVSPLPRHTQRSAAVCSLWHFPWGVTPAGCYPAPYIHGARTFLHGSLSAIAAAAVQPTDTIRNGVQNWLGQAPGATIEKTPEFIK
jgi:hypothetical protein